MEYWNAKGHYAYNKAYERVLTNCANRESTVQFFDGSEGVNTQYYNGRIELSNQDFLGVVLDYNKETGYVFLEERNFFKKGDRVEIFGPTKETISFTIEEILDEDQTPLEIVNHPQQKVYVKVPKEVEKWAMMRINRSFDT